MCVYITLQKEAIDPKNTNRDLPPVTEVGLCARLEKRDDDVGVVMVRRQPQRRDACKIAGVDINHLFGTPMPRETRQSGQ